MTGSVGKYHLTAWQCHCWCLRCVLMCLKVLNAARLNCTQLICRFCLKNWNEIKLNEKTTHDLLSHMILNLWVLWGPLHDVSVLSSTGTTNKGQIRSSLAAALRVHPHLLPRQSLLIHTGKSASCFNLSQTLGERAETFALPSDLHSLSDLLFVLYSYCVTEYLTAIWVSCLEHLLLLRRQFKS